MQLVSLNISMPITVDYKDKQVETGIYKKPVKGALMLSMTQLDGDGQADMINHGGQDKAVCVYNAEHYSYWRTKLQRELSYGAFGENFTVTGMTESQVCIGDIYKIGEAVVQISQPRQPCFKLALKHGSKELPLYVQETGYTGYYFRVLQEGLVASGQTFLLVEKHPLAVTVMKANHLKYHDKMNLEGIHRLLEIKELSDSWRESFQRRLDS